jgi:anthranilate synthase component 2
VILVIDNYDSFSWNLVDYLERTGVKVKIVRNDTLPIDSFTNNLIGVVLSPGPGKPSKAGNLQDFIAFYEKKLPILGICLGHQAIVEYFGGNTIKAPRPMHGKISKVWVNNQDPIYFNLPENINVVRYHSLVCHNMPMGVSHNLLPISGIQFHPEAHLTEFGEQIIKNWVEICHKLEVE